VSGQVAWRFPPLPTRPRSGLTTAAIAAAVLFVVPSARTGEPSPVNERTRDVGLGQNQNADYLQRVERHIFQQVAASADGPGLAVVTWVAAHLSALAIFVATLGMMVGTVSVTKVVWLAVWVVCSASAVLMLVAPRARLRRTLPAAWAARVVWASGTGYAITFFIGSDLLIPLVALVGVLSGTRLAALDASNGVQQEPGHYLRRTLSWGGLLTFGALLVAWAVNALVWHVLLSPLLSDALPGLVLPGPRQWVSLAVLVVVLAPAILIVCELISGIARHEQRLHEAVRRTERLRERERMSQHLHDRALSLLTAARLYPADHPGHSRALDELEMSLRSLQFENELDSEHLTVDQCLRRARALADLAETGLTIAGSDEVLRSSIRRSTALLVDQFFHTLVSNSVGAAARSINATLSVRVDTHPATDAGPTTLCGSIRDDAGGFDPLEALAKGGGLARMRRSIEAAGGSFRIAPGGGTISFALPTAMAVDPLSPIS
jgi:signal transduction histidine kinase